MLPAPAWGAAAVMVAPGRKGAGMADVSIGFVIFPGVTQLDFTGPYEVLSRLGTPPAIGQPSPLARVSTHVVAKTAQPVASDRGLAFLPTATFRTCPPLDILCVPGGAGVIEALADAETVGFIGEAGRTAAYVTSVCTGAFLLGAAGLLDGRRATTHWAFVDLLPLVGAIPAPGRVVRDGDLFTAGGVTAGIDFALVIAAELAGPEVAQAIQLGIEYDPAPPFDAGHPDTAPAPARALMRERNAAARAAIRARLEDRGAIGGG